MNILMPTGGVISPIIRLRMNTTPKWTGSIPTDLMSGISTGTSRMTIDRLSKKHPRMSRTTLSRTGSTAGSVVTEVTATHQCRPSLFAGKDPGQERGAAHDEHDRPSGQRGLTQNVHQPGGTQLPVDQRIPKKHGVQDRDNRSLGGGNHTADDPPQDEHRQHKGGQSFPKRNRQRPTGGLFTLRRIPSVWKRSRPLP